MEQSIKLTIKEYELQKELRKMLFEASKIGGMSKNQYVQDIISELDKLRLRLFDIR